MNKLLTSVICSLVTITTVIQADATRPRLVVGIVVDQLRTDYIEYLQTLFGEDGFRRLINNGAYLRNVEFRTVHPDAVSATAVIYTGAYPSQSGVVSANAFDRSHAKMRPTLTDGNSFSPKRLLLSTISDEIAIDGLGLGAIYSLSADPQQSVIMAGHSGNSAIWISDTDGRWTASPYYTDHYSPLLQHSSGQRSLPAKIDTMQWKPVLPLQDYPGIPAQKQYYPFRYTFSRNDRDIYRKFIASPLSNRAITEAAIDYLKQLKLGNRAETIDMLNLSYTAAPYKYVKDGDFRLELQDTYLRLDSDLGRLLNAIDKYVGLDNTLIYLSSTGYYDDATADAEKYRIPGGNFSVKRAVSLLNSFLSASYGNGNYISSYATGHFYLNDKVITDKLLDAGKVAREVRDFLSKMAGVSAAYTLDDILSGGTSTLSLRNSIDPKSGGDVYVAFSPGWSVTDDQAYPETIQYIRASAVATPFFIMGRGIEPQVIGTPVDATAIAPTITQTLRIRAPNGAAGRPLLLTSPK